jgi:hypothetical protein
MDDFRVAIDPRSGELHGTSKAFSGARGLRATGNGFNWRLLATCSAVVFALAVGVFLAAVVSELV